MLTPEARTIEVNKALSHLGEPMHPRLAVCFLAGVYGVTEIERRKPVGRGLPGYEGGGVRVRGLRGIVLKLPGDSKILLFGKGTDCPGGIVTVAHEIGHILVERYMGPKLHWRWRDNWGEKKGRRREERICEAFATELVSKLWQIWIRHWYEQASGGTRLWRIGATSLPLTTPSATGGHTAGANGPRPAKPVG